MDLEEVFNYSVFIASLYLKDPRYPGGLHRRTWPAISQILRSENFDLNQIQEKLRVNGYWEANARLSQCGILAWARYVVENRLVTTIVQSDYPWKLASTLGDDAPPVLWVSGTPPSNKFVAVVGSREAPDSALEFARRAGRAVALRGWTLVTGGASGCDRHAELGALAVGGSVVRFLPNGIKRGRVASGVCELSIAPSEEAFCKVNAMERNQLIYASSLRCLIAHAKPLVGGSWHGATEALRRKSTSIWVPHVSEQWSRALKSLGAHTIEHPEEFGSTEFEGLESPRLRLF